MIFNQAKILSPFFNEMSFPLANKSQLPTNCEQNWNYQNFELDETAVKDQFNLESDKNQVDLFTNLVSQPSLKRCHKIADLSEELNENPRKRPIQSYNNLSFVSSNALRSQANEGEFSPDKNKMEILSSADLSECSSPSRSRKSQISDILSNCSIDENDTVDNERTFSSLMSVKNMMPLLKSELQEGLHKIESVAQKLQVDPKLVLEEWMKTMIEEPALLPLSDSESKKKFLDLAQ